MVSNQQNLVTSKLHTISTFTMVEWMYARMRWFPLSIFDVPSQCCCLDSRLLHETPTLINCFKHVDTFNTIVFIQFETHGRISAHSHRLLFYIPSSWRSWRSCEQAMFIFVNFIFLPRASYILLFTFLQPIVFKFFFCIQPIYTYNYMNFILLWISLSFGLCSWRHS